MNYILYLAGLAPAARLVWLSFHAGLGRNPIERVTHVTGDWVLIYLVMTLSATPLGRWTGRSEPLKARRPLGLLAFTYACLHFLIYAWLDKGWDWSEIGPDLLKRRFIWAGLASLLCMLPLAVTSTNGWIRRLGRNWKKLHRLIYPAAVLGGLHYYLLVKADVRWPLFYLGVFGLLLGWRVIKALP